MPTQTLGKVKLTPRGAYDPAATYVPLDIVSYGGGSYCVLKNVTGITPTGDDVNYQLLAESGADGKSPQISASKTWLVWDANKGEYMDTGVSAAGEKGDEGDPGKAPIIGSNGNWYEWDDASGAYTDTGKPSRGEKGNTGAEGADGADGRDGITPTIGENGNWYLGETDTGKPSRGEDGATGAPGATGEKGADGKSAYAYAVESGYTGTEGEFAAKLAEEMPDKLPNPNALTFTGAVTGSYDGSEPMAVEIPSGGADCTISVDVLASGKVVQGSEEPVDTGVTLGMLKEYKMFILSVSGASNVNLHNWYTKLGSLSLSRVNNARAQTILYEFLNAEKTVLMPMIGLSGNHGVYKRFEPDAFSYGVYGNAAFPNCIYNLAGLNDNTTVITYPVISETIDVDWSILGVVK